MKTLLLTLMIFLIQTAEAKTCSYQESHSIELEYIELSSQLNKEILTKFNGYINQIKTKQNLTTSETLILRRSALKNADAIKLRNSTQEMTIPYFNQSQETDSCETLRKKFQDSTESSKAQWDIVFTELEKELNKQKISP